jgi:serine/threonine protein kinase
MSDARRIGPFAVGNVLAQGQDSTLYHAIRSGRPRTDQPVCIRVALDPLDPVSASAIRSEYEVLRAMDNPRIPKAYGHYADEAAFAMSHHPGASLSDVIWARDEGRVRIGTGTAIDLVIEVAHALRHANSILNLAGGRIVHGHLSPDRVRLTPDGNVVVIGFGTSPHGLDPAYMAPEIARGEPPCPASDQWALGAMLIELILGERLYTGIGDENAAAQDGDIQHWRMAATHAHPALEEVLSTTLALNPDHRFSKGHELLKALLAAGRRVGGTVSRRSLTTSVLNHAKQRESREMRQPSG